MLKNDPAFGLISRVAKKKKIVATSNCWMQLASTAAKSNPFQTEWLGQQDHRDWAKFLGATWGRLPKKWFDENGDRVLISKAAWFSYGSSKERGADGSYQVVDHPNQVWLKFSLKRKDRGSRSTSIALLETWVRSQTPSSTCTTRPFVWTRKKSVICTRWLLGCLVRFAHTTVQLMRTKENPLIWTSVDSRNPRKNTSDEDEGEFSDLDMA